MFFWEFFNVMSHSFCRRRVRVDSRLLVVGSQIVSLIFDLSFTHNLGCRCPNGSCEAILDIYTPRPFQWYKAHPNARCFDPCNRALSSGVPEDSKFPLLGMWVSSSHLTQSGVATLSPTRRRGQCRVKLLNIRLVFGLDVSCNPIDELNLQ